MSDSFYYIKGLRTQLDKFLKNYTGQDVSEMNEEEIKGLLTLMGLSIYLKLQDPGYFSLMNEDDECTVFEFEGEFELPNEQKMVDFTDSMENGSDERRVAIASMSDNQIQKLVNKEPFQPEKGQWCWFWDDAWSTMAIVLKFAEMNEGKYMTVSGSKWVNCAPFEGKLPPHLKE